MRTLEQDLIARYDVPTPLWLAQKLREDASCSTHEIAADVLERLYKQLQTVREEMQIARDQAYKDGRREALYEVRNSINERFGL